MNKVFLLGRLTQEPVCSQTNTGKTVAKFSLAVDRGYGDNKSADFISCIAWDKRADFAEKYLHKGTKVAIEGNIKTGSYTKNGQKYYTTDVVIDAVEFAGPKEKQEECPAPITDANGFMSIPDDIDEELPFK